MRRAAAPSAFILPSHCSAPLGRRRGRSGAVVARAALLPPPAPLAALPAFVAAYEAYRDAAFRAVLSASGAVLAAVQHAANDPWGPEELFFIPLYAAAVPPVLRAVHRAENWVRRGGAPAWESSWQRRCEKPLQSLSVAFLALWAFDNGLSLAHALGSSITATSTPLLRGVPVSIYTMWAAQTLLGVIEGWRIPVGEAADSALLIKRASAAAVVVSTVLLVARACSLNLTGLAATTGLLGLSFSLALRDLFANVVAGMSLVLWRPFLEGDEITVEAKGQGRVTARVEAMGIVHTTLRDSEGLIIIVPNALLTAQSITNREPVRGSSHSLFSGVLTLRHEDMSRIEALLPLLAAALRQVPQLDEEFGKVSVSVTGVTSSGVHVKASALFKRSPLSSANVKGKAWLALGQAVLDGGCQLAKD